MVGAQLWAYLALIGAATTLVAILESPGSNLADTIRISMFTATPVSSTGHWVVDWSVFEPGLQMMLVLLIGIGAMSGSVGGGFRIVRAMALFSFLWRELAVQLQPRLVRVVKVGREVVPEPMAIRILGYQALYVGTAAAGFVALAAAGADVVTALSGSVKRAGDLRPRSRGARGGPSGHGARRGVMAVLGLLMFAGRIELYPLLDGIVWVGSAPRRVLQRLGAPRTQVRSGDRRRWNS
ncbi:MAG: potassium transporter TrkG [Microthrixaceae bacterium]